MLAPSSGATAWAAMKLTVIVPVYNERATVGELLRRVCAAAYDKEVLIFDDASTDGTVEELRALGLEPGGSPLRIDGPEGQRNELRLFVRRTNKGKGAAVRDGIARATGEIVLIQDADLEYDPAEYPILLQPILDGRADVVYGSRFIGSPHRVLLFWHWVGNFLLTFLSNMFTNLNLTDMETCYKAFRTEVVRGLRLRSNRFGIEPEITAKVARRGARIYEVAISYSGRSYLEGKKINWKDGLAALWTILKYSLVPDERSAAPQLATLNQARSLRRYHAWLYEQFVPYVGQRVLEVGADTVHWTRHLRHPHEIVATDADPRCVELLGRAFADQPRVRTAVFPLGAALPQEWEQHFDTVLCWNTLERLEDDVRALERIYGALRDGGSLVLGVSAMPRLFGALDRALGYRRRYSEEEILEKLRRVGFAVERVVWLDRIGALAWWVNSKWLRRTKVPRSQTRIHDWVVPWLRWESRWRSRWGALLMVVARRPSARSSAGNHENVRGQDECHEQPKQKDAVE